jgi:uncharacterized protein YoaH (UPF0181 family)
MRTVTVNVVVKIRMLMDEGIEVGDAIDEMDYAFNPSEDRSATVEDTEIIDYEVVDSK